MTASRSIKLKVPTKTLLDHAKAQRAALLAEHAEALKEHQAAVKIHEATARTALRDLAKQKELPELLNSWGCDGVTVELPDVGKRPFKPVAPNLNTIDRHIGLLEACVDEHISVSDDDPLGDYLA